MIGLAPRALEDSVRPRRPAGAHARPLSLPVRFRMPRPSAFLLAALVMLGATPLPGQTKATVHIFVSAENCVIGNLELPCSGVGERLRELGTPLDAPIDISGHSHSSYEAMSALLDSLRRAGFKFKMGYVNVREQ